MSVVFSRLALAELDEILTYLGQRSPSGAKHVEARILRALAHIGDHPFAAEGLTGRPDVRRLPLSPYPYVIYYEVADDMINGLAHSARRKAAALGVKRHW